MKWTEEEYSWKAREAEYWRERVLELEVHGLAAFSFNAAPI